MVRRGSIFGQFGETARCHDANFFVSNITSKPLDRFARKFQGRCEMTMGRPAYIFGQFREIARCRDAQHGDGVCCTFAPQRVLLVIGPLGTSAREVATRWRRSRSEEPGPTTSAAMRSRGCRRYSASTPTCRTSGPRPVACSTAANRASR